MSRKMAQATARTAAPPETIRVLMPDGSVQRMGLDEYLKGVVPAEMGTGQPFEALKAQAIASRSYAATARRHLDQDADICTTTHCQVWRPQRHTDTDRAVEATSGVVATYRGEIIHAFFFTHCDGHTRNSEDVWTEALPYCRSVPCICGQSALVGHGVGMCQVGAIKMAEEGATAQQIIEHYSTGVEVKRRAGGCAELVARLPWSRVG